MSLTNSNNCYQTQNAGTLLIPRKNNTQKRFFGNVDIGKDISIDDMQRNYHAVVFAYGCASEYKLKIPGEDLNTVYSAREFVAWLNGHPDFRYC